MITVQLEPEGPITLMDEVCLERSVGDIDNENERTSWVEYRLPGSDRVVHRSVHIALKKGLEFNVEQGNICE